MKKKVVEVDCLSKMAVLHYRADKISKDLKAVNRRMDKLSKRMDKWNKDVDGILKRCKGKY